MRLDKFLAHSGFGTRKEVKSLLKQGIVCVNDVVNKKDKTHVDIEHDIVTVDGEVIHYEEYVYYMLHKPAGYVSATEDNLHPTVVELIDDYYRDDLFPVGRLDIDTEGLLLMTNDGQLAHQLLSPKKHCPKIYYAKIDGIVDQDDIDAFARGITIDDYLCKEAHLKVLGHDEQTSEIEVEIYEGKFHQIKKMFLTRQKPVLYLKRIQMKNLVLDEKLKKGDYRRLTEDEINSLTSDNVVK